MFVIKKERKKILLVHQNIYFMGYLVTSVAENEVKFSFIHF